MRQRSARATLACTALIVVAACGDGGTEPPPGTDGAVRVTAVTTGGFAGPTGYVVMLDGVHSGTTGTTGELLLDGVAPGTYSLGVSRVAGYCAAAGTNPRQVTVAAGEELPVVFTVACGEVASEISTLIVETVTTGSSPDPNGYTLSIDGATQPLAVNGGMDLTHVAAGPRAVALSGVAAGCTVADQQRTVDVIANIQTTTRFEVTCGGG